MELLFAGLIKLLGSAGFGTVFGGAMGWFNRRADLDVKKLELEDRDRQRAHELEQRKLDAAILEREYAARIQVATIEGVSQVDQASYQALAKSYDFAPPQRGSKMESFSTFVRPFISIAYFVVSTVGAGYVVHRVFHVEHLTFSPEQWFELVHFVISWMAFMAGTTVGWWFAARSGTAPQLARKS